MSTHVDVLIIGGGMSGIGAACHLSDKSPDRSWLILEGREAYGGTWDLFRYPGIRSDSDMYTFGYNFRPWEKEEDIASADAIRTYLDGIIEDYGLKERTRLGHRVSRADWSSEDNKWTVAGEAAGKPFTMTCNFLLTCTGYYNYDQGYLPEWPGYADFAGEIAHPQHWPEDLEYDGKSVVVIGSGATAVTLVPSLAKGGAKVTMLQRSPGYVFSRPSKDAVANFIKRILPQRTAHTINRWKNALTGMLIFQLCKRFPEKMRSWLTGMTQKGVGDSIDFEGDLMPDYMPWDQRLCLIPDDDLYLALRDGSASVETGHIEQFQSDSIRLTDGRELKADIIVPATGLQIQFLGGMEMAVDGNVVNSGDLVSYRGMMMSGIPNWIAVIGYTNASWTLKSDLTNGYVCRLLNYMQKHGYKTVVPALDSTNFEREPLLNLNSGYIKRAADILPSQGATLPWRNHSNYLRDLMSIKYGRLKDGVLEFR